MLHHNISIIVFSVRIFLGLCLLIFLFNDAPHGEVLCAFYFLYIFIIYLLSKAHKKVRIIINKNYVFDCFVSVYGLIFLDQPTLLISVCFFIVLCHYQYSRRYSVFFTLYCILLYFLGDVFNQNSEFFDQILFVTILSMVMASLMGGFLSDLTSDKDVHIESLSAKIRTKDKLMSTLSHEIKTPLTMIISSSDILIDELRSSITSTHHGFIKTINSSALRLLKITEDILAQIKLEQSFISIHPESFDLRQMVQQVILEVESTLNKK